MSRSAWRERSEGINRLAFRLRLDIGLQLGAVGDIDPNRKKFADEVSKFHILEDPDRRFGIKLDQEIDVTGWCGFTAHDRPEQGGMPDAPVTKLPFMGAQSGNDLISIHTKRLCDPQRKCQLRSQSLAALSLVNGKRRAPPPDSMFIPNKKPLPLEQPCATPCH